MTTVLGKAYADSMVANAKIRRGIHLKGVPDPIRIQMQVSALSSYSDAVWNLTEEYPELHPANVTLRFSRISFDNNSNITSPEKSHLLRPVKEFLYSMIKDPPSSYPKWSTVCAVYHKGLGNLVRYMDRNEVRKFSHLTQSELSCFIEELASLPHVDGKSITNRALRSRAIGLNWLYDQSSKLEDGLKFNPFSDYGTISQWADKCCNLAVPRHDKRTIEMPDAVAASLLSHALADLSLADKINDIHKQLSVYKPIKKCCGKRVEIVNPFPWHEFGLENGTQIKSLESRLAAACYIVIAMLTGMRWHEIAAIKSNPEENWFEEIQTHDGVSAAFSFVVSTSNKLQAVPMVYRWQTLPIVKLAIDAAAKGLARRRKGGNFLFPSYMLVGQRASDSSMGHVLKKFATLHNITDAGIVWKPASHQFRKKFARIMTRQGLGIRELQDQLKHFDIEMTRGYGDMNLYVELQREKFLMSKEQYEEIMSKQKVFIGGGGEEIRKHQKLYLGMTRSQRERFLEELTKSALIEQVDDGLCMFRPHLALCGGNSAGCRPGDCNNGLMLADGKRRTLLWRKYENERLIKFFESDPLKVTHLKVRNAQVTKLLSQLDSVEGNKT